LHNPKINVFVGPIKAGGQRNKLNNGTGGLGR